MLVSVYVQLSYPSIHPPPLKKDLHNEEIENFIPNLNSHQGGFYTKTIKQQFVIYDDVLYPLIGSRPHFDHDAFRLVFSFLDRVRICHDVFSIFPDFGSCFVTCSGFEKAATGFVPALFPF